ncbi:MAG: LptA/OstA family protein [Candidatus Margulisiibacteriota bacterium]
MIRFFFTTTCLFALLLLPSLAQTADTPVNIKADKLKFFEDSGQVEATGSVEVKFTTVTIQADRLLMDSASNVATAEGHVRLSGRDYQAEAGRLVYNADTQAAQFGDFRVKVQPQKMTGPLSITARSWSDDGKRMGGGPGGLSTCSDPTAHYFLTAQTIDYYPEDRVEARNVVLFIGDLPLFWWPYIYYSLKDEGRKNWLFGHNEVEGDYLKTSWVYPLGILLVDYMDKKGWGLGTDSQYTLGALGLGSLYLYNVAEKDTGMGSWVERIKHSKQLGPNTNLKIDHSYVSTYRIPSGRIDQTTFGLDLSYAAKTSAGLKFDLLDDRAGGAERYNFQFNQAAGKESMNYVYNYEFGKADPKWLRKSQRFNYRTALLGDHVVFNTTANYYHSSTGAGDSGEEKVEPQIDLSGSERDFSWRYSQNWLADLRQADYPGTMHYQFLEKQPELEISPRTLNLSLFNLQSTFGYGRYREVKYVAELGGNRDFTTSRYRSTLNAAKALPLGASTTLNLSAGIDQFLYGPGDQLYALREGASLNSNWRSCLRNDLTFRQGYTDGNTPFFFDQLGSRYHDLQEKLTFYHLSDFSWSLEGGHNWQTSKWFDVMTRLMAQPAGWLRWTLDTGWDIENTRYKDLVTALNLTPASYFGLSLSLAQDLNGTGLRSASALYDWYLLEKGPNEFHFRVGQVFDPATRELKVRDIMLVKQLHCWEMKYAYSDYRKEFSFTFSLKALPGDPVGFAGGRGFYFDSFEKELRGLKPEGEIRRY